MTQLVGIFGYPLSHSMSPVIQQAAFDYHSLDVRYEAWSTPPEQLESEVSKLRGEQYLGANVTVPHKEYVREFLDEIDPWAKSIGAVNTIVREGGRLVGYNTDAYGFIRSLKEKGDFDPKGRRVLLLGAGGAARAIVFGLAEEGVSSLAIANRTVARAESLASEVSDRIEEVGATALEGASFDEACEKADLIVNSTSIGMSHGGAEERTIIDADKIPSSALVCDIVYNPPETPLLKEAKKAGARTLGGLPMLIYQGAAAFEKWTGKQAPTEVMFRAAETALGQIHR